MLKYNDYLIRASRYYSLLNEDEFNEIVKRFDINSIDYSDFNFDNDNLEYYIVNQLLIENFGDCFFIDDIYNNQITLEFNTLKTPDVLDDVKEFLESFGYTFINYDDLKEESENLYQKAKLLIDDFLSDKLEEFIKRYIDIYGNQIV